MGFGRIADVGGAGGGVAAAAVAGALAVGAVTAAAIGRRRGDLLGELASLSGARRGAKKSPPTIYGSAPVDDEIERLPSVLRIGDLPIHDGRFTYAVESGFTWHFNADGTPMLVGLDARGRPMSSNSFAKLTGANGDGINLSRPRGGTSCRRSGRSPRSPPGSPRATFSPRTRRRMNHRSSWGRRRRGVTTRLNLHSTATSAPPRACSTRTTPDGSVAWSSPSTSRGTSSPRRISAPSRTAAKTGRTTSATLPCGPAGPR